MGQSKLTVTANKKFRFSPRRYSKILNLITQAETLEQLLSCVPDMIPDLMATYHHFGAVGAFDYKYSSQFYAHNMPPEILNYLDKHRKHESNPGVMLVLAKGRGIWLSEMLEDAYIIEAGHLAATRATLAVTGDALCIPLYGPNSRAGYIFLAFGVGKADCDESTTFRIEGLAQRFHVRYCLMLEALNKQVNLTPREAEVLELITFGKSNKAMATILGISDTTVSGYVKRIFLKLDVSDRVSAAMRAQTLKIKL